MKNRKINFIIKSIAIISSIYGMMKTCTSLMGLTYFTTLSNLFITGILLIFLIHNIINQNNSKKLPDIFFVIKFLATISITLTFFVFLTLLAPVIEGGIINAYLKNGAGSLCVHFITPILAIIDFLFFDRDYIVEKKVAFYAVIPPLLYVLFIVIASSLGLRWGTMLAPYNFLNYGAPTGWFGLHPHIGWESLGIGVFYMIILLSVIFIYIGKGFITARNKIQKEIKNDTYPYPICGEVHKSQLEGYKEEIKSKEIIQFEYTCTKYSFKVKKEENEISIFCIGGSENTRDGSYFKIKFQTKKKNILKEIQKVIDKNEETKGNGYCVHVDGLPPGLGDLLSVEYASGEKIYKISNQSPTVREETSQEFYEIFHNVVKEEGYDFTSEGSNMQLYDDADEEYLQGTWTGKHFGREMEVTFKKNKITIKVDGNITDNEVEYIIYEGMIKKNKKKEDREKITSYNDYENFEASTGFRKKNNFILTAYFTIGGYSSCELHNFEKEKSIKKK